MSEVPADAAPDAEFDHPLTPQERRKAIIAATLGNGLEFYDFITFAFFAIQIGHAFFPSESAFLSLMGSLATFFVGFLTRPLGAYILGGYADRVGRKPAMMISMSLMGAGIILLVITPGYATIGYAAPVIAVIARMIQGFALGGEVGSATIYMMEGADPRRRGWSMSWQGASQNIAATIGSLVGLLLAAVLSEAELSDYGWRIALALGVTIVPVALWVRNSLPETVHHADTSPVAADEGFRSYIRPIVCGLIIIGAGTIGTYIFQYMATYGQNTLKLSPTLSLAGEFANNGISVIAVLIGGAVSDRKGRKHVMLLPQALFCVLVVPCFLWLTSWRDAVSFIGANLILSYISGYMYGAVYAAISESIPKAVRARVFALVYAVPVTFLGGSTQLVVTWILEVTGNPMSIAWYLTGVSLIGLVAMWALKESAPVKVGIARSAAA
ncbi:MFS transporter [Croceibacterium aestuarii]|uniref:MFS transporter n=1 Tax=Croceibacterium aestuarii TaxID=3064139 RepID=UPI00272E1CC2|nr:MFS transporter [Croceibacterium sp. D39]